MSSTKVLFLKFLYNVIYLPDSHYFSVHLFYYLGLCILALRRITEVPLAQKDFATTVKIQSLWCLILQLVSLSLLMSFFSIWVAIILWFLVFLFLLSEEEFALLFCILGHVGFNLCSGNVFLIRHAM